MARSTATRLAAAVAVASGAVIVIGTIALRSFSRADAGEAATDLVRSELTPEGLAQHRADFEIATAAVEELYSEAFPALAEGLGSTPEGFELEVQQVYPAVAEFLSSERREAAYEFAEGILSNLEQHQQDFEEADAIPVSWMPMDVAPWVAVGSGGVLLLAGVITLWRPSRLGLAVIAALGLGLVIGPLVTRFPQKAAAARDLLDSLRFTPELVAETRALLEAGEAATEEFEHRLLPDLAAALQLSAAELDDLMADRFPAVARARPRFDEIFRRYEVRVRMREGGLEVVPEAAAYPLTSIGWWAIGLGAVTAVPAAGALIAGRRRRSAGVSD